jgi:guanine deaminase
LVFAARGEDVTFTMVDGEMLMEDGEVTVADADAIREDARAVADSLDLSDARENAQRLKP